MSGKNTSQQTSVPMKKKTIEQLKAQIKEMQNKNIEQEIKCTQLKQTADDLRIMMKKVYQQSQEDLRLQRQKQKKLTNQIQSLEAASKVAHSKDNINGKMGQFWKEFI